MLDLLQRAREKFERDRELSWHVLLRKTARYAVEMASAPLHLRAIDERGSGARTMGRPRIDNLGRITLGKRTLLRSRPVPVELVASAGAVIEIGDDVHMNYGVSIGATGSIRIGHRVRIGPYTMIIDNEFHDPYDREKRPDPKPVVIEDDVWIGAKVSVMPGVTIGRGSIVGVASVVFNDVPPFTVVLGVPARPVRRLEPEQLVVPPKRATS